MYQSWMEKYDEIVECAKNTSKEDILQVTKDLGYGADTNVATKTPDELLEDIGFKKQAGWTYEDNKIIYENEKKTRFIIFHVNLNAIEISTEHGFSNFLYLNEISAVEAKCKELGMTCLDEK